MKYIKIILITLSLSTFISCEIKPFIGYIIYKDFIPEHMSDVTGNIKRSAYIPVHIQPIRTTKSKPHLINDKYIFHVANIDEVRAFTVSEETFGKFKKFDKVKF